ncbi:MAG TPA: DUF4326 domain-containing protein [Gammaproteobacteria bacterium]|nr:DUF4326 domain-containing protein [Gammaproteobacteria bacterium]
MSKPHRIQLSRKKGWRMPPNTVKVNRTTKWGNPFTVSGRRRQIDCVYWFVLMTCSYLLVDRSAPLKVQEAYNDRLRAAKREGFKGLRGKNLACWCRIGDPCHADHLLNIVNGPLKRRGKTDLDAFLDGYGYHFEFGKGPVRNADG